MYVSVVRERVGVRYVMYVSLCRTVVFTHSVYKHLSSVYTVATVSVSHAEKLTAVHGKARPHKPQEPIDAKGIATRLWVRAAVSVRLRGAVVHSSSLFLCCSPPVVSQELRP